MVYLICWVFIIICVYQVNVASLENVVRFYLHLAEEKTEAARQESHQAVVDIDDLDNVATPESILLRYIHTYEGHFKMIMMIANFPINFVLSQCC